MKKTSVAANYPKHYSSHHVSHICSNKLCIAHLVIETSQSNQKRKQCVTNQSCDLSHGKPWCVGLVRDFSKYHHQMPLGQLILRIQKRIVNKNNGDNMNASFTEDGEIMNSLIDECLD